MEVGGRRILYTYRYTVTTRMTHALRWKLRRLNIMTICLVPRLTELVQKYGSYERLNIKTIRFGAESEKQLNAEDDAFQNCWH